MLWQKRFWKHAIRDDREFETHVNYIHINPIKHLQVVRAADWPHSTIHRYIERGMLTTSWAYASPEGEFGDSCNATPEPLRWSGLRLMVEVLLAGR